MEPIIYTLPKSDREIKIVESEFYFDSYPSPKLIKYGFSHLNNQLDLKTLFSTPYYKVGQNFDFERTDENSLSFQIAQQFGIKKFDLNFAKIWELLVLFPLLDKNQTISVSNDTDVVTVEEIIKMYKKIKTATNKYTVTKNSTSASLIIYKYSDIDIEENAAIHFIIKSLPKLLSSQTTGSNMIIQLFDLQTKTTAELIYYLSSIYNEAYLLKPTVIFDLSDEKYLVLIGLKKPTVFKFPKNDANLFLYSLGLDNIPDDIVTIIQCMNAHLMPKKYNKYKQIKEYLNIKVYEGATYQDMIKSQNTYTKKWLETFLDITHINSVLDTSLSKTQKKCTDFPQLSTLLS